MFWVAGRIASFWPAADVRVARVLHPSLLSWEFTYCASDAFSPISGRLR